MFFNLETESQSSTGVVFLVIMTLIYFIKFTVKLKPINESDNLKNVIFEY